MTSGEKRPHRIAAQLVITGALWTFMLSDGALRMLVLLYFHMLDFSPIEISLLFLFYEVTGIVTYRSASRIAARFGLINTLYAGLCLQVAVLLALANLGSTWMVLLSVLFVMTIQGVSGVCKDLDRHPSSSSTKTSAPIVEEKCQRAIALTIGLAAVARGVGFLAGAMLLIVLEFPGALVVLAVLLSLTALAVIAFVPSFTRIPFRRVSLREIFPPNHNIRSPSVARILFLGSRDVWFIVGVPIYFLESLSDGTPAGNAAACFQVGLLTATWIIVYGIVLSTVPLIRDVENLAVSKLLHSPQTWTGVLMTVPAVMALLAIFGEAETPWLTPMLVFGLLLFGIVSAFISSIQAGQLVVLSRSSEVALHTNFYISCNTIGRFIGTMLSGISYQFGGLVLCLAVAGIMVFLSLIAAWNLNAP